MHGGPSTGPRTQEGRERCRKSSWKHGRFSAEAIVHRREARALIRAIKELIDTQRELLYVEHVMTPPFTALYNSRSKPGREEHR